MTFARKLLNDMAFLMPKFNTSPPAKASPQRKSTFHADYYAITPKGTRARFTRSSTLGHVQGAASETAILALLQKYHPGCTIQIQDLTFD
jgi:hypothetical protein